jgi:hypothetical protein
MADPPLDGISNAGTPRWVKVFGIIAIVLLVVFIILHLTGNRLGSHTPPIEHKVEQP